MPTDDQPLPSVWTRGPRRQRDKPTLSRERIVSEAVRLADEEGIDALSMRRLGTRLGVGATSIYWHVANKYELIELIVDEVYGELDVPKVEDPAGWRAEVADCARSMRAGILRHPWVATVVAQTAMASLGQNAMLFAEGIIGTFRQAGLSSLESERTTSAIGAYVLGTAGAEAAWLQMLARTGESERELFERFAPVAEEVTKDHPYMSEVFAVYGGMDPAEARDDTFEYGLQLILDGIEARLANG